MAKSWIGETIGGRYEIDSLLGQGGMSAVYRATDPNLRRMVAIKLIHPHLSVNPNFVHRFKEEAAAVARLRHPNIVQVHDFDVDGETYYMVMEYLTGESLQANLNRLKKSNRFMPYAKAIQVCTQMCEALGYAHKHGLIHRDIKPANIMLDINDQAILMDFGIVKIIGGEYQTATGATMGTVKYMSPEQMRSERVDESSDIYSLGVTLYEMISGSVPYIADSVPSLMMMALNDPLPDLGDIRKSVPEKLLRVVEKALEKEKVNRFQTMEEMADGLAIAQEAVKKIRMEETVLNGDAQAAEALPDIQAAKSGEGEIERVIQPPASAPKRSELKTVLDKPIRESKPLLKVKQIIRQNLRLILMTGTAILLTAVAVYIGLKYSQARRPPVIQIESLIPPAGTITSETAQYLVGLGSWEIDSKISYLAFSPDGTMIGTANNRDRIRFSPYRFYGALWGVDPGSIQHYLLGHTQWVYGAAFSPDGQLFATASDDDRVTVWDVASGSEVRSIEASAGGITSVDFSANSMVLALGTWDGTIDLWQIDGRLLRTLEGHELGVRDVEFSPNGGTLASGSDDGTVRLWRVSNGQSIHILEGHTASVRSLDFSPDGEWLASASEDNTIGLWNVNDGKLMTSLQGNRDTVLAVDFSVDGSMLASGADDGSVMLWNVPNGEMIRVLDEHRDSVSSVGFSPRGDLLAVGTWDGVVKFWGLSEAIQLETETPAIDS